MFGAARVAGGCAPQPLWRASIPGNTTSQIDICRGAIELPSSVMRQRVHVALPGRRATILHHDNIGGAETRRRIAPLAPARMMASLFLTTPRKASIVTR